MIADRADNGVWGNKIAGLDIDIGDVDIYDLPPTALIVLSMPDLDAFMADILDDPENAGMKGGSPGGSKIETAMLPLAIGVIIPVIPFLIRENRGAKPLDPFY